MGLAVCMTMLLYLTHEYSYDSFNKNADRIFAIGAKAKIGADTIEMPSMSFQSAPIIQISLCDWILCQGGYVI